MSVHYKELADRAYYYHTNNLLEKAEELYMQLLAINPDDVNVLNLLGMLYLSKKDYDNAIKYISKAFLLKKSSYLATNLAKAYFLKNDTEKAIKMYQTALKFGESDDLYYSLAIAYKKNKNIDKCISCYEKAIKLNPNSYNAIYNLAIIYKDKKDYDQAMYYTNLALRLRNDDDNSYSLLSECYENKNQISDAILALNKAIAINNKKYVYFYNIAALYVQYRQEYDRQFLNLMINAVDLYSDDEFSGIFISYVFYRFNCELDAISAYKSAIAVNPKHINSYINLASIYNIQNRPENCIELLNSLLKENPDCKIVFEMLAISYMDVQDYENAVINYKKAIDASGANEQLLQGYGAALKNSGKNSEAVKIFESLYKSNECPDITKISLGMLYLMNKEFKKGYELYRNRSKDTLFYTFFKKKIWKKSDSLHGKDILLYSDCGFGDTIMYSRYLNLLAQKVKTVTVQTDIELIKLLSDNFAEIKFIKKGEKPPKYDIVMPFMDIQYALDSDFSQIPNPDGYLISNTAKLSGKKKKIGLFWNGSDKVLKNRSVPFELISQITTNKKYSYYSFQIDREVDNFINLKDKINDFSDTASLLKQMDLLITIDSAIVHLAGALGVKTYLLLPYASEWRWFDDTNTTPWYDSVKIFKQPSLNDWQSVINQVKSELEEIC